MAQAIPVLGSVVSPELQLEPFQDSSLYRCHQGPLSLSCYSGESLWPPTKALFSV